MTDHLDLRIMKLLVDDGRISISELSEKIGLSPTPTAKRVKRLEDLGFITGYEAKLAHEKLGGALTVFTWVSLVDQKRETLNRFEQLMEKSPQVLDCYLMTGDADYLLRIAVDSLSDFERFLTERISNSDKVSNIRSSFAIRPVALNRPPPALFN